MGVNNTMNIYVGNLSYDLTEKDLQQAFEAYGQVVSSKVVIDKYSGKSRGFGFVEMVDREAGQSAIKGLDGQVLKGRPVKVSEARPQKKGIQGNSGAGNWRRND